MIMPKNSLPRTKDRRRNFRLVSLQESLLEAAVDPDDIELQNGFKWRGG